jgi:hypothetical protein
MGSYNGTCAVSNIHITNSQRIAVFMLTEKTHQDKHSCYTNSHYEFCPLPFYAEYNDYGAGEHCNGIGLNIIVDSIREKLFEFEPGANKYHDIAVKKEAFDINLLWEAAHENRLSIESEREEIMLRMMLNSARSPIEQAEIVARLTSIKARGITVIPIMVRCDILDYILENDTKDYHYRDPAGNFSTETYRFRDLINGVPDYVKRLRNAAPDELLLPSNFRGDNLFRNNERNYVVEWFRRHRETQSPLFEIFDLTENLSKISDESAIELLSEFLKGLWLNEYMDSLHKAWSKPITGGQVIDHQPYQLLNDAVQKAFKQERIDWEMDD